MQALAAVRLQAHNVIPSSLIFPLLSDWLLTRFNPEEQNKNNQKNMTKNC